MKRKVLEFLSAVIFSLAVLYAVVQISEATLPYRDGYGCLWRQYLLEEKDSINVMFFGSSLAYCNVIPSVIYEETECTAYVMAGPQLTIKQTYYYMKEAFKTQSPKLVFLETAGMFFSEFTDYSRINIGYMPYSLNRAAAAFFAVESEERLGALFTPYNYHELWLDYFDEDKKEEAYRIYTYDKLAGYTFLRATVAQDKNRDRSLTDYNEETYAENLKTLKKIIELCNKKGANLVLYSTPMYKPLDISYYEMLKEDIKPLAVYYDFNADKEDIGLDMEEDFYDIFHLNYKGAIKFSRYITPLIKSYKIEKTNKSLQLWKERTEYLEKRIG